MKAKRRQTIGSQIGMDFCKDNTLLQITNANDIPIAGKCTFLLPFNKASVTDNSVFI